MDLDELLSLGAGGLKERQGLDSIRDHIPFETRLGLSEVLVGRIVIALGKAVGGSYSLSQSAVELLRRQALATALRELMGLVALYGISADELEAILRKSRDG